MGMRLFTNVEIIFKSEKNCYLKKVVSSKAPLGIELRSITLVERVIDKKLLTVKLDKDQQLYSWSRKGGVRKFIEPLDTFQIFGKGRSSKSLHVSTHV